MLPLLADIAEIKALAAVIAVAFVVTVPIVSYFAYRWRVKLLEADLKYELIQRGMSADEIERVLAAPLGASTTKAFTPGRGGAGGS